MWCIVKKITFPKDDKVFDQMEELREKLNIPTNTQLIRQVIGEKYLLIK